MTVKMMAAAMGKAAKMEQDRVDGLERRADDTDAWKEWAEGELGRLRDALDVIGTVATLAAHPPLPTQDS